MLRRWSFERGYQDGYGRSRYQYDGGGYFPNSGNNGVVDTRDGVGPHSRTITVPGTQQWVPTNSTIIIAPASGMLYLGINDDPLNDNSGQFTVVLSW